MVLTVLTWLVGIWIVTILAVGAIVGFAWWRQDERWD